MVAAGVEPTRVIGVDLGGTKIRAGVVDRAGTIGRRTDRATPLSSQNELLEALDDAVEELLTVDDGAAALGFGIPSTIDQRRGRAVVSVNVPLADLDLRDRMAARFRLPVGIENDANAAALAEWAVGCGRGTQHLLMLTLGTGIGGGLILDGRLYRGSVGAAAELGHMVIQHEGPPCGGACDGRGHLEALAAGSAVDELARTQYGPGADARDLVERAERGEEDASGALAEIGRRLGSGLVTLVNVFNPELIVIGGGFGAAGELVLGPARAVVREEALSPARDLVRVVPAALGPDAGLVGAGLIAFEALETAAQ
jgi:glucokinase